LGRVDRVFHSLGLSLATCVFAVLDRSSLTLRWSNAGHPPPLLLRDGQSSFLTDGAGIMLGVIDGSGCEEASTALQEGDVLVLYTDGLVERRGESVTDGFDRLARVASRLRLDDAEEVCNAVLSELLPPSTVRSDDVALLVARVVPSVVAPVAHRLDLEASAESASVARGFTAGVLQHAGWNDQVDTATLLVSELVTNALRHSEPPCALSIRFGDAEVEISVEDGNPSMPAGRPRDELAEDGRGFVLIDALATDWGSRPIERGKATWFTLRPSDGVF
jgi:anti-sigma regulatory factor (Ser/Thr protein kinase)